MSKEFTEQEIKDYQAFASLSLDERRRRIVEKFCIDFPDSEFTRDVLSGRYPVSKRKVRKKGNKANKEPVATTGGISKNEQKQKSLFRDRTKETTLFD